MPETGDEAATDGPPEPVRLGVLVDLLGFHLRVAQDASFRAFARHSGHADLKPGRFAALTVIRNNPGISQVGLSRAIARDKSTLTPLIQELQRRGFILRRPSKRDRRSITLRLTPEGEAMLDDLSVRAGEHDRRLDEIVGADKAIFLATLRRIAAALG